MRISKLEFPTSSGKLSHLLQITGRKCSDFPTVTGHVFDQQSAQQNTVNINEEEEGILQLVAIPGLIFLFFFCCMIYFGL